MCPHLVLETEVQRVPLSPHSVYLDRLRKVKDRRCHKALKESVAKKMEQVSREGSIR